MFQQVPESFESLTNCVTLKLDDNQIEKLPDNLGRMTALEELYAAENFLTFLPPSIGESQSQFPASVLDSQSSRLAQTTPHSQC